MELFIGKIELILESSGLIFGTAGIVNGREFIFIALLCSGNRNRRLHSKFSIVLDQGILNPTFEEGMSRGTLYISTQLF